MGTNGAQVVPAPVGGWNARDALEAMDPADAVTLDNWIPGNGVVVGRGGSRTQVSTLTGPVDSLVPYNGDTSNALLAAANGHIYVVANDTGFISPVSIGSGFSSNVWQWGTFDTKTVLVNGTDAPQVFNGTTLSAMTVSTLSAPTISGITTGSGTLAAATYYYKVTAVNVNGETTGSAEVSHVLAAPGGNQVTWGAISGATGYNIYRSTVTNTEHFLASVGSPAVTFLDDGSLTPTSTPVPSSNTTNVNGSLLVDVVRFKGRAFYAEVNSQRVWYAAPGSFQGMLTKLDFSTLTQLGGTLIQVISSTRDSGDGVDDYIYFVFSSGEVLAYQGDDPSNVNRWSLIGLYHIGAPLGRRAHSRFASTEILLTKDGFQTLDEAIQNARIELIDSFGGKIFRACKKAAQLYAANFGWQAIYYPRGNLFIANVPTAADAFSQYVKNTNTGMWCQFTGWNARCFGLWNDRLYFGTNDGKIKLADVQQTDGLRQAYSDDGVAISYNALTAYQKFGQPGLKCQITSAKITANVYDGRAISLNAFADYRTKQLFDVPAPVEPTQGQWDQSPWNTDAWASNNIADPADSTPRVFWRPIQIRTGYATAISIRYKSVVQNVYWYSTEFLFSQAGVN